jgi:hypothetical protein
MRSASVQHPLAPSAATEAVPPASVGGVRELDAPSPHPVRTRSPTMSGHVRPNPIRWNPRPIDCTVIDRTHSFAYKSLSHARTRSSRHSQRPNTNSAGHRFLAKGRRVTHPGQPAPQDIVHLPATTGAPQFRHLNELFLTAATPPWPTGESLLLRNAAAAASTPWISPILRDTVKNRRTSASAVSRTDISVSASRLQKNRIGSGG